MCKESYDKTTVGIMIGQSTGRECERERTAYEAITEAAEEAARRSAALLKKRDELVLSLGRNEMNMPASIFVRKYDLYSTETF